MSNSMTRSRLKPRFTHFLSIPFTHPSIQERFLIFKERVLANPLLKEQNIDESLFQKSEKLHLTFGIMTLVSLEDHIKACKLLETCEQTIIKPLLSQEPIVVDVRGLGTFSENSTKTHVLYAEVRNAEKLQTIADSIVEKFVEAGLMEGNNSGVNMHITVMNSIFRMRNSELNNSKLTNRYKKIKRESFDASQLIKEFIDFSFAPKGFAIPGIHLSEASKVDPTSGYYGGELKIKFLSEKQQ